MSSNRNTVEDFGVNQLELVTLENENISVQLLNLGATVYSLKTNDSDGQVDDIVLGYPKWVDYITNKDFLGCIAGRFANRIAKASFSLNGQSYKLAANEGSNCLHGGKEGLHKKFYEISSLDDESVTFKGFSPDGEDGFPGNLYYSVRYSIKNSSLMINYEAKSDKDTVINLTNHSYFNLAGHQNGSVLDHEISINASRYLPVDDKLIPLDISSVEKTPFDLREKQVMGTPLRATYDQIQLCGGVDHCFILENESMDTPVATAVHPYSGRVLEVFTTEPAVQFYTSNHIDDMPGKDGAHYGKYPAFCLETQHYPDSPNRPDFPSTILKAGDIFKSQTVYKFATL